MTSQYSSSHCAALNAPQKSNFMSLLPSFYIFVNSQCLCHNVVVHNRIYTFFFYTEIVTCSWVKEQWNL